MKRLFTGLIFISLASILFACESGDPVSFSDDNLEDAVREKIDKSDDDIYESDLEDIEKMDLADMEIEKLDGIEAIEKMETLSLENNDISDFSPLEDLESLDEVDVTGNPFLEDDDQITLLDGLEDEGVSVEMVKGDLDGPGGFLWKVENDDTTVYLQGTIHLGNDDLFPLNEKSERAYMEADVVVPEVDITDLDMQEQQELTEEKGIYDDGSSVEEHISDELYSDLEDVLDEYGLPIENVKNFKPWVLSDIVQQFIIEEIGYSTGVDEYFLNRAHEDEKDVEALETMELQLSLFADTSEEMQEEELEDLISGGTEEYEEEMDEMLDLYKNSDEDELLDYLYMEDDLETGEDEEASDEEMAFKEALLDDRNEGMAEQIADYLDEGSDTTYFVIVGSLHLIEDPHVQSFLEDEGYEIEQIL